LIDASLSVIDFQFFGLITPWDTCLYTITPKNW